MGGKDFDIETKKMYLYRPKFDTNPILKILIYESIETVTMRISSEIANAINDQIAYEASATHAYVAIGSWCERTGYDGSATFFFEQSAEENTHMMKFVHYLNISGAEAIIPATEKPQGNFDSLESTFQAGLKSEQTVTKLINNLVEIAEGEKDRATYSFLQWFVSEQIEEETLFETILQKFEVVGRDKIAIYQIDRSLASIRSEIMAKGDSQQQPSAN